MTTLDKAIMALEACKGVIGNTEAIKQLLSDAKYHIETIEKDFISNRNYPTEE